MNKKWILILGAVLTMLLALLNYNTHFLVDSPQVTVKNSVQQMQSEQAHIIDKKKLKLALTERVMSTNDADFISVEESLPARIPVEEWRKPSKAFEPFLELNNKALNTKEERDNYKLLIDSGELLAITEQVLLAKITENEIDYVKERARLDALYYLSSIISGKYDSSQFDIAVELAIEVLNQPTVREAQGRELKKSLLGDKIEIGLDLAIFQPKLWQNYKSAHSGNDKHQELLAYIDNEAEFQQQLMLDKTEKLAKRLKQR